MIVHAIGVDSAGHTFGSQNEHIERKLRDTENMIEEVISRMDNDTTLIVFGDHGMT
jgi:phosphatidylinositol glycan class O